MEKEMSSAFKRNYKNKMIPNESIMFYGDVVMNKQCFKMFQGIGVVYRVVKGEKLDLVYVRFSTLAGQFPRIVIVINNRARRQIATLKRGQVCQVYGMCRYSPYEYEGKKRIRLALYAEAIIGWYVPTTLDIKKLPPNEDIANASDKEKDLMENYDELLNEFMVGKEELDKEREEYDYED